MTEAAFARPESAARHGYRVRANLRDLGGHVGSAGGRVPDGRTFRSGFPYRDPLRWARWSRARGIGLVIDLRSHDERQAYGIGPDDGGHRSVHVPIVDSSWEWEDELTSDTVAFLTGRYLELLSLQAERMAAALEELAAWPGPALFHCSAGKDRTGLVAALLLLLAGVDPGAVATDYALSARSLPAMLHEYDPGSAPPGGWAEQAQRSAHPDTMTGVIREVHDRWGSAQGYLRSAGLDRAAERALVRRMTRRGPPRAGRRREGVGGGPRRWS